MRASLLIILLGLLWGCGPRYHPVAGKVTLDNTPLGEAMVSFIPEVEDGAVDNTASSVPSSVTAKTDQQGNYSASLHGQDGLLVGRYSVRITTFQQGNPEDEPPTQNVPERVPSRYNLDTTLQVEVKPGENTFDFPLDSQGQIFQPQ